MFVEGNPAPTFKFFKGTQEIIEGGRYKLISDGDNNNMIMMAIAKVKAADESEYRVEIENCHGSDEANFMLFVSGYFYVYLSTVWPTFYGPDGAYISFYFSLLFSLFRKVQNLSISFLLSPPFAKGGSKKERFWTYPSLLFYAFSYLKLSIIDPTTLSMFLMMNLL